MKPKPNTGKRIGINTLFMIPNAVGGTEYHLRSTLSQLEQKDVVNEYIVFCNEENYDTFEFTNPRWKKVRCQIRASFRPFRICYEQIVLPFQVLALGCDLLHSFGYFGPIISPVKHIITIHDVNWRDCPEDFGFFERMALRILIELNIVTCTGITVVSEFTKERLTLHFPSVKDKVYVTPSGVNEVFLRELEKKHAHPLNGKQFLLCVSAMYPHKKIPYVLDVWEQILEKNDSLQLVLIGRNGKDEKNVKDRIKRLPRIQCLEKVSLPKLVSFYQHTLGFVFPSAYEGFGYPVFEALASGLTVYVGNNHYSLPKGKDALKKLTFDAHRDAGMILEDLKKVGKKRVFESLDNKKSVSALLTLYKNTI